MTFVISTNYKCYYYMTHDMLYNSIINKSEGGVKMKRVMKLMTGTLIIRIGLWGMFIAGLAFNVLTRISALGVVATVGILLMAIDYPKKEKRNNEIGGS